MGRMIRRAAEERTQPDSSAPTRRCRRVGPRDGRAPHVGLGDDPFLARLAGAVDDERACGHHASVFGAVVGRGEADARPAHRLTMTGGAE